MITASVSVQAQQAAVPAPFQGILGDVFFRKVILEVTAFHNENTTRNRAQSRIKVLQQA
jgi:hypothetical protein